MNEKEKMPNLTPENGEKEEKPPFFGKFKNSGLIGSLEMENEELNKESENEKHQPGFAIPKGEQTPEAPPTPETEKDEIIELTDVVKEEKTIENKIEQTEEEKNLDIARENYFEEYKKFLKGSRYERLRASLNLPLSSKSEVSDKLKELKTKYDQAKQNYALSEFEKFKLDIEQDKNLNEERRNELTANCKNEIFRESVLEGLEKLGEIKKEALSESKKGLLSKSFEKYKKMKPWERIAFTTIVVTGAVGFASLAVPVSSIVAALGLGTVAGKRILRGSMGVLLAGVTGKAFDKVFKGGKERVQSEFAKQTEESLGKFDINKLGDFEKKYQTLVRNKQKADNKYLIAKMLTMGAVGAGAFAGLSIFDDNIDTLIKKHGVAGTERPVVRDATGNSTRKQLRIDESPLEEEVSPQREVPETEETSSGTETLDPIEAPQEETVQKTTPDSYPDLENHKVESGETLWKILKSKIPEIENLGRNETKDNVIANLIEEIKKNPQDYGVTSGDVNSLKVGDNINLEKIQDLLESKKIGGKNLIEHAKGLGDETLENIKNPESAKQEPVTTKETSSEVPPVREPNTTNRELVSDSPEFEKVESELDGQIVDIHEAESNLANAEKTLETMRIKADGFLKDNPESHKEWAKLNHEADQQSNLIEEMKKQLEASKENLSVSQKNFENMLIEAHTKNDLGLDIKARLGLAEIASVSGDKTRALELFNQATKGASRLTNPIDRIDAFTNIAVKESSAGFIDKAKSAFDFAERTVGAINENESDLVIANYLKIANQEALLGFKVEPESLLKKITEEITKGNINTGRYSGQIEDIKKIIIANK